MHTSRLASFGFLVLLVVLAMFPAARAEAKDCTTGTQSCTYSEAWQQCQAAISGAPTNGMAWRCTVPTTYFVVSQKSIEGGPWGSEVQFYFTGGTTCPAGQESVPEGGCKCAGGFAFDPNAPGECLTPDKCTARNDALGNSIAAIQGSTNGCFDGCAMSMGSTYETRTISQGALTRTIFRGQMRYNGSSCNTPPTKDPKSEQPECAQMTGTQTICVKNNGEFCGKGSNGRLACWRPGETGEKTDGPDKHIRQAGPTHTPPNLQLPNGDTLVQTGPPVVDQQTGKPGPTYNGPVTNNTTNTATYTTQQGTNAGPVNEGENGNGDGGGKEDDGKDDDKKDGPKLSGGDNCNVPPVCDVVDDAACKSGIIAWKFQCDGSAEVGSAQDQAQTAVDLLNVTWDEEAQQFSDGAIQRYNEVRTTMANDVQKKDAISLDMLDNSGFLGGGQCPQFPPLSVAGANIPFDFTPICSLFGSLGLLVEALAYIVALRIITRS